MADMNINSTVSYVGRDQTNIYQTNIEKMGTILERLWP